MNRPKLYLGMLMEGCGVVISLDSCRHFFHEGSGDIGFWSPLKVFHQERYSNSGVINNRGQAQHYSFPLDRNNPGMPCSYYEHGPDPISPGSFPLSPDP